MEFKFINPFSEEFLRDIEQTKKLSEEHKTDDDALVIPGVKYRNSR